MKFSEAFEKRVDMSKVNPDTIKSWINEKVTELLGFEDDVVIEFIYNQLEEKQWPDGKEMQINLTRFLNAKNAHIFMAELWELLVSAMDTIGGIPAKFLEQKKEESKRRQAEQERIQADLKKKEEEITEILAKERRKRSRSKLPYNKRGHGFGRWGCSPSKSPRLWLSRSKSRSRSPTPPKEEPAPDVKMEPDTDRTHGSSETE